MITPAAQFWRKRLRPGLVWLHRWVGLLLATFLVVEGLTGSLLAFRGELTVMLDPALAGVAPTPASPRLDLVALIRSAEAAEPRASLRWLQPLTDDTALFLMDPKVDPKTGKPYEIDRPYVALDPWSGRLLKRLKDGMYSDGLIANFMPFVYDLHKTLAVGEAGVWVLSVVALLWTLDCVVAVVLTLPLSLSGFWGRWKPAWLVRWSGGAYRVNFDLHRAGGLWPWAILFAIAWSSVALEPKTGVYEPVMQALFGPTVDFAKLSPPANGKVGPPALDWEAAQIRGRQLLEERAHGYRIGASQALSYSAPSRTYWYRAHTDRLFPEDKLQDVFFDADTGAFLGSFGTYTGSTNSTLSNWFIELHMINDPVDYVAYRWFMVVVGLVVAILSVTGIVIWWVKRRARSGRFKAENGH